MRKASVMIEVSDELYNTIVEPYKKRKSFGKLIVQLLEGYKDDDAINNYVNNKFNAMSEDATEAFMKDYQEMTNSLNMFSFLQAEAESTIQEGQHVFSNINDKAKEDATKYSNPQEEQHQGVSKEEVQDIVKASVDASMQEVKDMLMELILSQKTVREERPERAERVEEKVVEPFQAKPVKVEPIKEEPPKKLVTVQIVDDEKDVVEDKESEDLMNSLLGSLGF